MAAILQHHLMNAWSSIRRHNPGSWDVFKIHEWLTPSRRQLRELNGQQSIEWLFVTGVSCGHTEKEMKAWSSARRWLCQSRE